MPRRNQLKRLVTLSAILAGALAPSAARASERALEPFESVVDRIVNGVPWGDSPEVGLLFDDESLCSGTLIGCRTFLTAAHCICGTGLSGAECRSRQDLLDPSAKRVFFQHGGVFQVSNVSVHPDFEFGEGADLAVLRLSQPVSGIRPARINQLGRPPHGTPGLIVGFGATSGAAGDSGLKRAGLVETAPCQAGSGSSHVCWSFVAPIGEPGEDASTCVGDSGGPLFLSTESGPVVAGVTSGGSPTCLPPNHPWDADVFVERAWITSAAGGDLHNSACGSRPFAGSEGAPYLKGLDGLSGAGDQKGFSFEVPPGVTLLAATLNAPVAQLEADLYLRRGAVPTPATFDCRSRNPFALESCLVQNPGPGTWHLLARQTGGAGPFQVTVTLFEETAGGPGDPPPPPGPWLSSSALPNFEAKVRINDVTEGAREPRCIAESLCVSGALAGRPEVFIKVIGPRPNGFLWTQLSRFTPSKVEVWLRQTATGVVRYYELSAVPASSDDVSGLQDRRAFVP